MQAATDTEQQVPFLNIQMRQQSLPLVTSFGLCLSHTYHHGILQVWPQRARKTKDFSEALWSLSSCLGCAEHTMQVCRREHFSALFGNKMPLKGRGSSKKKRRKKASFEAKYGAILSLSQGKKGLFQSCSGEARNKSKTRKMREKPPGVLAPEEEANSDSPKAFLPANLLLVPDCCQTGVPTTGKLTSSI